MKEIEEWALEKTEEQITQILGVGLSNWNKYKNEHEELRNALKKGRDSLVKELKSKLIMKARGFHYTESKKITEKGVVVREEIYDKYCQPDVAALNLLLKNYDKENWSNDPQMLRLKERELEMREKTQEQNNWWEATA